VPVNFKNAGHNSYNIALSTAKKLFDDHLKRFSNFIYVPDQGAGLPQRLMGTTGYASEEQAILYNRGDRQLEFYLQRIPWIGWRKSIQLSLLGYINHNYSDDITASILYFYVEESLCYCPGNYLAIPTPNDFDDFVNFLYSSDSADKLCSIIEKVKIHGLGDGANSRFYFACRIFHNYLWSLKKVLRRESIENFWADIALKSCEILLSRPWPQEFWSDERLHPDLSRKKLSPNKFNFWHWQYTHRNDEYRAHLNKLIRFVCTRPSFQWALKSSDYEELFTLHRINSETMAKLVSAGPSDYLFCSHYNLLIDECYETFYYFPTWPSPSFTSDLILRKMIFDEFHFYDRCQPRPFLDLKGQNLFEVEFFNDVNLSHNHEEFSIADIGQNINKGYESQKRGIREERKRVRDDKVHRACGLWIYDYAISHSKISINKIIEILIDRFFPDNNSGWDSRKAADAISGESWIDYKYRMTINESSLFRDYLLAKECVNSRKYLTHAGARQK